MPTVKSSEEAEVSWPLALRVQFVDERVGGEHHPTSVVVYPESDPEWVPLSRIATFADIEQRLSVWNGSKPSEHLGCFVWSGPGKFACTIPLLDAACPTLEVTRTLLDTMGWGAVDGHVVHTSEDDDKLLDGREATSMKYFRTVFCRRRIGFRARSR